DLPSEVLCLGWARHRRVHPYLGSLDPFLHASHHLSRPPSAVHSRWPALPCHAPGATRTLHRYAWLYRTHLRGLSSAGNSLCPTHQRFARATVVALTKRGELSPYPVGACRETQRAPDSGELGGDVALGGVHQGWGSPSLPHCWQTCCGQPPQQTVPRFARTWPFGQNCVSGGISVEC